MIPAAKEEAIVPEKAKNASLKFFADLAAGGVAGGISKTVVAPIERVKLLLQTQDSNPRIKSGKYCCLLFHPAIAAVCALLSVHPKCWIS